MEESRSSPIIRFGIYEADMAAGELRKNGRRVKLQGKPFEIMAILLEHAGEVVSREQIHKRLWPVDTFVDFDHGLNNAVNKLRFALGDSADNPRFITTVGRRGYRFIAPIDRGSHELAPLVELPECSSPARLSRASRRAWIAGSFAILILVSILFYRGIPKWVRQMQGSRPGRIQSLAVLPLENLSSNPEEEYFADGMTDELTTELAAIGSLRVISRTSVMHYRHTAKTLPQIGRELGVDAIVEGSVVHFGNRVRINAQLIETATDHHLWAKTYDRETRDILVMQSQVAQAIALAVRGELTPREQARFSLLQHQVIPEAHEAYLKGRYCLNRETEEGLEKGKGFFNAALNADPSYAPAWAGLADSYYYLSNDYLPPAQAMPAAKAAAERALAIDDTLASAHTSLALIRLYYDWDLPAAGRELGRSIELNPNDAAAHLWYGMYYAVRQRPQESLPELRLALQLDPLSLQTRTNAGLALYLLRDYERLATLGLESIQLDPNSWGAHANLGGAYEQTGKLIEAITEWGRASELSGSPVMLSCLGHAYASAEKQTEARKVLGDLKKLSEQRFVPAWSIAAIYIGLDDKEQALTWLEKAYLDKSESFIELKGDARFDSLRSDPRFVNLLRRVGLQ